jgi:hypothetical protein
MKERMPKPVAACWWHVPAKSGNFRTIEITKIASTD